jgi:hypothetical protein
MGWRVRERLALAEREGSRRPDRSCRPDVDDAEIGHFLRAGRRPEFPVPAQVGSPHRNATSAIRSSDSPPRSFSAEHAVNENDQ